MTAFIQINFQLLLQEVCKNETSIAVTKSEQHQSVITATVSNNKILVNSMNKPNDKGISIDYFYCIYCIFDKLLKYYYKLLNRLK